MFALMHAKMVAYMPTERRAINALPPAKLKKQIKAQEKARADSNNEKRIPIFLNRNMGILF